MIEFLPALALFAFVSSITPGPNNLMLMASGANFGMRLTLPHMFGVALGFTFMLALVGLGIVQLFDAYPLSYTILQVASVAYLLFLAYKIATSASPTGSEQRRAKPFTFIQAALFQWVNPKAWTMALTAVSLYAPDKQTDAVLMVAIVFGMVNFPSISVWVLLGQQIKSWLASPARLRTFNMTMAVLLVGSLYPVFL